MEVLILWISKGKTDKAGPGYPGQINNYSQLSAGKSVFDEIMLGNVFVPLRLKLFCKLTRSCVPVLAQPIYSGNCGIYLLPNNAIIFS